LLEVGLSARGGGGNTVRNVTACPRAAFCPKAVFDVAPHAIASAEYLLQSPRSYNLPRKYKIAFSGCHEDCAFASVNDLGFFAHERNGQQGFAVYAAGGLGSNPAVGVLIEEFISPSEIFEVAEAIERLFERFGDRTNKNQARLRYVVRRLGREAFIAEYQKERATLKKDGLPEPVPAIRPLPEAVTGAHGPGTPRVPAGFLAEHDPQRLTLHVQLLNGRISSQNLLRLAQFAREFGSGVLVATQQQDLLVPGIRADRAEAARSALAGFDAPVQAHKPKIVACAGASTCKLGLCLSPRLADAIEARLRQVTVAGGPAEIRISGCPNNCGNHIIAPLGLEGRARRSKGRLMPLYEVLADGKVAEGLAQFGQRLGAVPARRIPDLLAEIYEQGLEGAEAIRPLVQRYAQIPDDAPDELYTDVGSSEPFSLAGRGPGECGAGVLDIVRVDLQEAAEALAAAQATHDRSPAIHRALSASARALLPLFGQEARKDREVFAAVAQHLAAPGWVGRDTEALLAAALDWRLGDRQSLNDLLPETKTFCQRVRDLFDSLDNNLQFRLAPLAQPQLPNTASAPAKFLDLRGVACPMNFVKAKVVLETLEVGQSLEVLLDDGPPVENVPASFTEQGQEILGITPEGPAFRVSVKRSK
jgi:sulfite reductase (ferredoxin)